MLKLDLLVFGINVNGLMTRQSLWICVTGQSLVTRGLEFKVPLLKGDLGGSRLG